MQETQAVCELDTRKDARYIYSYSLPQIFLVF